MALPLSYVLPLRWTRDDDLAELAAYVRAVSELVEEVIVIDGSAPELFRRHGVAFGPEVRHLKPHRDLSFAMGKVNGVATGVREARCERVVIADDDVRYDADGLASVAEALDRADLVRPQNYFEPLVWHARLDTARILLNRVASGDPDEPAADFPGTLGVRRSVFVGMGGYDGNALFENLELIRTIRAVGGRVASPLDLYVARRPPSTSHFVGQRVRQAYDDFALPRRMAAWLTVLPGLLLAARRRRHRPPLWAAAALCALAEAGRRRAGGAGVFPASSSLLAPAWVLERGISAWLALGARLRGGARYGGRRIGLAANSPRELRRRYRPIRTEVGRGSETGPLAASKPISL